MGERHSRIHHYGLLAEFRSARDIFSACEKVRDAGYRKWDALTPFPVHGLDKAMGLPASRLPWIIFAAAMIGAVGGMAMQWWVATQAYPLVISGKPLFSWQAFIPVTFEVAILFGASAAVLGMLGLNKLPMYYHPLFRSRRMERVTDDRFFIAIEAADAKYDPVHTANFLKEVGATHIERVEL